MGEQLKVQDLMDEMDRQQEGASPEGAEYMPQYTMTVYVEGMDMVFDLTDIVFDYEGHEVQFAGVLHG